MIKTALTLAVFIISTITSSQLLAADAPLTVSGATIVDATQAKKLFDEGALFVDTRRDSDWAAGRILDAIHLELKSVFTEASLSDEAGKDEPLVFYCNGPKCDRSAKGATKAVSWGFSNVYYFRDGFPAWKDSGFPVE